MAETLCRSNTWSQTLLVGYVFVYGCDKIYQGKQGYCGNQTNAIRGQRPDMEIRHTQQRTQSH